MKNKELINRDLTHIFHPCTQMRDHFDGLFPLIPIKSAKGVYLYDFDGNSYIDAISSWWTNLFGHSNEYINQKIKEQIETLEHVIFAGFTHLPAINLAERLIKIAPKGLNKIFFVDNGSSGIEVALKMSFHAHKNMGKEKELFVSLTGSYHGETLGALAVGGISLYKDIYSKITIKSIQTKAPKNSSLESANEAIQELEKLFLDHKDKISAFIIEPLIQCANGMKIYHPSFLTEAKRLCEKFDIHLIADEVAVGFGRTGTFFACEQANITPDFMVLSKGLTGGYLPLAVVLFKDEIFECFNCDYLSGKNFLHSHSYTGNPISCTVANGVLDIFEKNDVLTENTKKSSYIKNKLEAFRELKNVAEVRSLGMIFAIELKGYEPEDRVNLKIYNYAINHGVLLRPLGNVVYFMPPYVIEQKEIDKMLQVGYDAICSLL